MMVVVIMKMKIKDGVIDRHIDRYIIDDHGDDEEG